MNNVIIIWKDIENHYNVAEYTIKFLELWILRRSFPDRRFYSLQEVISISFKTYKNLHLIYDPETVFSNVVKSDDLIYSYDERV